MSVVSRFGAGRQLLKIWSDHMQHACLIVVFSFQQTLPILDLDELMKQDNSGKSDNGSSKNEELSDLMTPSTDLDGLMGGMITAPGGLLTYSNCSNSLGVKLFLI